MLRKQTFWLAIVMLTACSPIISVRDQAGLTKDIQWPPAPSPARILFAGTFSQPEDLGLRRTFTARLWEALAGAQDNRLVRPYAIAVREQKILVADPGASTLHLYDTARNTYKRIAMMGKQPLDTPVGVAIGGERLFVSDSALGQVFVLDMSGELLATINGLERPTGMAFDEETKRLYVADTLTHRIVVFSNDGEKLFQFGKRGTQDGQFNFPSHIHLSNGRLLINDNMNFRIQAYDVEGRHLITFGAHGDGSGFLSQPKGVASDSRGYVYVAGGTIDRVQIFSPEGEFLLSFGASGNGPGEFLMPAGLTIMDDMIYVADSYNQRIQMFRYVRDD